jgi:hypothetical protein
MENTPDNAADKPKRSEKYEAASNTLPDELKPVFDNFVADYRFAGTVHHGSPFVSYIILAEMVRQGWRLAADPLPDDPQADNANRSPPS